MSDAAHGEVEQDEILGDMDEIDVELRSPVEVRSRVLILAAVLRRLMLENATAADGSDPTAEAFDEREWLRENGLTSELLPEEALLLDGPLKSVPPEAIVEASWQGESLVALAWAIRILDLPPVGTVTDPGRVIDAVPRPWDEIQGWRGDPEIVSESEAVREREIAEIWYWRATTEVLRRGGPVAESQDYDEAIREVAAEALD